MTRPLQARLTLCYAAGVFAASTAVLAVVLLPLAGLQSTNPAGHPAATTVTDSGNGIGPHRLLIDAATALAVLLPLSLALGWLIAGRFLQPLRSVTATAKAISAGSLHHRLGLGAPTDELTELGHTLDALFARLEASFDAQRHFIANASHELRTPLAALRTLLEVTLANPRPDTETLRSTCQEALSLSHHQEHLIQSLLTLATTEQGVTNWTPVDLSHIAQRALTPHRPRATSANIRIHESLPSAPTIGDPALLETLTTNLIDNAIRHNHPTGHINLETQTTPTHTTLTVTNTGPPIPESTLPQLLHPFQHLSPTGPGLGLAIVNAITKAHGGTLTPQARPGGGLCITVSFPTSPRPTGN